MKKYTTGKGIKERCRCFIMDVARSTDFFYLSYLYKLCGFTDYRVKVTLDELIRSGAIESYTPEPQGNSGSFKYYKVTETAREIHMTSGYAGHGRMTTIVINGRVAGVRDLEHKMSFGGTYFPASDIMPARFETTIIIAGKGGFDRAGRYTQNMEYVSVVFWNGRTAPEGKGLADIAAKTLSPGKGLSFQADLHSYQGRIWIDGLMRLDREGNPATTLKHSLVVTPGTLSLGADSMKQEKLEIDNYRRNPADNTFWSRPPECGVDQMNMNLWSEIRNRRMSVIYDGEADVYGYALVRKPAVKA